MNPQRWTAPLLPLLPLLLAACASHESVALPDSDAVLREGERLDLPLADPFPRLGLQWVYEAKITGYPAGTSTPPVIAYRFTARDQVGYPWAGWWHKGKGCAQEFTGATIRADEVFFHPPRVYPFQGDAALTDLQLAPWPVAKPGKPGKTTTRTTMDPLWESITGKKEVEKTYTDVGPQPIEVPAGLFANAWYVEGASPGWKGRFWWADHAGWARMLFTADDGRTVDLQLAEVRLVKPRD